MKQRGTLDGPPDITEVHELTQACSRLLAGHSPQVVGATLADLTATLKTLTCPKCGIGPSRITLDLETATTTTR